MDSGQNVFLFDIEPVNGVFVGRESDLADQVIASATEQKQLIDDEPAVISRSYSVVSECGRSCESEGDEICFMNSPTYSWNKVIDKGMH